MPRLTATELRRLVRDDAEQAAARFVDHVQAGETGTPALVRALLPKERDALLMALFGLFTGAGARVH